MKTVPLGKLTTLVSSGSTPLGGAKVYLSSGSIMLIRSQNVLMRALSLDDVVFITEEIASKMQRTVIEPNDVLLNITGASIGRVATFEIEKTQANVNQHVCIIRTIPELLYHRYLMHFIAQPKFQAHIANTQDGGTRQALTFDKIRNFQIPLPPIDQQKRIAAILDRADAVRQKRREAIALTEELLRSTFLEMFGDPVTNPKGWKVVDLKSQVAELRYGTSVKCHDAKLENNVPVLRIPNILAEKIEWKDLKYIELDRKEVEKLLLKPGDLLFVRTNGNPENIGRCAVFEEGYSDTLYASYLIRARLKIDSQLCSSFVRDVISFPTYRSRLVGEARTTAGNYNISTQGLGRLRLIVPPIERQKKYLQLEAELNAQIRRQKYQLGETNVLFNSLLQKAFRGEL